MICMRTGPAIQKDFGTVDTRHIWTLMKFNKDKCKALKERAPCSDTGSGLTGWEATLLEKPGVLVDSTVAEG